MGHTIRSGIVFPQGNKLLEKRIRQYSCKLVEKLNFFDCLSETLGAVDLFQGDGVLSQPSD